MAVRARLHKELVVLQGEEDELRVSLGFPIVHPVTEPSSPPRSALETNANAFLDPRAVAPTRREVEPSVNSSGKRWRTAGKPHTEKASATSAVVSSEMEGKVQPEAYTVPMVGAFLAEDHDDSYLERMLLDGEDDAAESD